MVWWVEYKKLIGFVVVLISSSVAFKLVFGDVSFDLGAVSMFDMLSISIAFFAIGISFAFYFQASNTSNQFYDNTYKFTNEVSEILGRIEGAFGEKLSHLDDSYSRMDKKLDRNFNPRVAEEKLEANEDEKESSLEEQKNLIDDLVARAQMSEADRDSFYGKWKETQERLMHASEEISLLNRRLEKYRAGSQQQYLFDDAVLSSSEMYEKVRRAIFNRLRGEPQNVMDILNGGQGAAQHWYQSQYPKKSLFRRHMHSLGLEEDGSLNAAGLAEVMNVARSLK